jgi:hypothetical protein
MIVDRIVKKNYIGGYLIDGEYDGTILGTTVKPTKIKKILIEKTFGWKWVSIDEMKELKK